jgi:hypothetical protein
MALSNPCENETPAFLLGLVPAYVILLSEGRRFFKCQQNSPSNSDPNSGFTLYTILKGQHFATSNFFQSVDTDALQFMVRFDSSAIYQSIAVENQHDINKLYGFSDNGAAHHQFSARFGWSWTDGQLWLYAYVYNNGERTDVKLCAIPMNQQIRCAILCKRRFV